MVLVCSAVSRTTEIPLSFLDARNAPGMDMVVDYSGIVLKTPQASKVMIIRVIVSGCILSVGRTSFKLFLICRHLDIYIIWFGVANLAVVRQMSMHYITIDCF